MEIIEPSFTILHPSEEDSRAMVQRIERAGRTCYKSEDRITADSAQRFVCRLIDSHHESVLEHESITVLVVCDRGVSHEIVRHRIGAYSQESTRYVNYGKRGMTVIKPCFLRRDSEGFRLWLIAMEHAEAIYNLMLDNGCKPQEARAVLPNSLKTEIVITYNVRQWRHFFRMRTSKAAHPQMREIAVPMLGTFQSRFHPLFTDIRVEE